MSRRSHGLNDLLVVDVWHKTSAAQPLLLMTILGVSSGTACEDLAHEEPAPWRRSGCKASNRRWRQVLAAQCTDAEVVDIPHGRGLLLQELLLSGRCSERVQRAAQQGSGSGPSPAVGETTFAFLEKEPRRTDLVWLGGQHGFAAVVSLGHGRPSARNLESWVVCMRRDKQTNSCPMRRRKP